MEKKPIKTEVDIFRDTYIRYLGYANEVGEAFGPIYPKFVKPSYVVSFSYCLADTVDKVIKSQNKGSDNTAVFLEGFDCLAWQTLASVLIPGKAINLVTSGAQIVVNNSVSSVKLSPFIKKYSPTVIGLATIPFIIKPIDHAVDYFFDNTLRSWANLPVSSGSH